MWHDLFTIQTSWGERALRAVMVYLFLLVAIRVFGRRELGQLTGFDIIVLLTISNILQNSMIGNDNSVTGGVIGALVLLAANFALAYLAFKSHRVERAVQGEPKILIHDGTLQPKAMASELLSEQDLMSAIRREGLESFEQVRVAIAEPNGMISVIRKSGS